MNQRLIQENISKIIFWQRKNKSIARAVIFGIAAAFSYSVMAFFVKVASGSTTESTMVFFRFAISLFWVVFLRLYMQRGLL